jgi:hypothetical protein
VFNRLVVSPGNRLYLGSQGGTLILSPSTANTGHAPGAMSLFDLQCRVLSLLREDGPDTGYPMPTSGDFTASVMARDLTIALGQFIADTGIAPDLSDRMDTFPVLPLLDYPVPLGLVSLTKVEYTPAGGYTYSLDGVSMSEFDNRVGGIVPNNVGQPLYYRQPWAGYIRLYPQPGPGNAVGPGLGIGYLTGAPSIGDHTSVTVVNGTSTFTTPNYVTTPSDTLATIAVQLATLLNATGAVTGFGSFLSPATTIQNQLILTALLAPGTGIQFKLTTNSTTMQVSPTTLTYFSPNGDTITFYYSSLGIQLDNPGDVPGIPPQYHMALAYRVLGDYWLRKSDRGMAADFMKRYQTAVDKAKAFTFDTNRASQPTVSGEDSEGYDAGWFLG